MYIKILTKDLLIFQKSYKPKIEVLDDDIDLESAMEATSLRKSEPGGIEEISTTKSEEKWAQPSGNKIIIEDITPSKEQKSSSAGDIKTADISSLCSGQVAPKSDDYVPGGDSVESERLMGELSELASVSGKIDTTEQPDVESDDPRDLIKAEKIWRLAETLGSHERPGGRLPIDDELEGLD